MRFTKTQSLARAVAQLRAATTRFTLWTALGAVLLPCLQGADDPCSSAADAAIGQRAEVRAEAGCAPTAARRDDVAAAREYSAATGGDQGSVPLARRSVALRVPDSPPVVKSSWTNTLGSEFVWIPAVKFIMGSPADEALRQPDEVQYGVTISAGYWMGKHEVTQREWVAVMGSNPSYPVPWCDLECPANRVSWCGTEFSESLFHGSAIQGNL